MWGSRTAVADRWSPEHWWPVRSERLVTAALEPSYMYIKAKQTDRPRAIMEQKKEKDISRGHEESWNLPFT